MTKLNIVNRNSYQNTDQAISRRIANMARNNYTKGLNILNAELGVEDGTDTGVDVDKTNVTVDPTNMNIKVPKQRTPLVSKGYSVKDIKRPGTTTTSPELLREFMTQSKALNNELNYMLGLLNLNSTSEFYGGGIYSHVISTEDEEKYRSGKKDLETDLHNLKVVRDDHNNRLRDGRYTKATTKDVILKQHAPIKSNIEKLERIKLEKSQPIKKEPKIKKEKAEKAMEMEIPPLSEKEQKVLNKFAEKAPIQTTESPISHVKESSAPDSNNIDSVVEMVTDLIEKVADNDINKTDANQYILTIADDLTANKDTDQSTDHDIAEFIRDLVNEMVDKIIHEEIDVQDIKSIIEPAVTTIDEHVDDDDDQWLDDYFRDFWKKTSEISSIRQTNTNLSDNPFDDDANFEFSDNESNHGNKNNNNQANYQFSDSGSDNGNANNTNKSTQSSGNNSDDDYEFYNVDRMRDPNDLSKLRNVSNYEYRTPQNLGKNQKVKNGIRVLNNNIGVEKFGKNGTELLQLIRRVCNFVDVTLTPLAERLNTARFVGIKEEDKNKIPKLYDEMDKKMYILTSINTTNNSQLIKLDKDFENLFDIVMQGLQSYVKPVGGSLSMRGGHMIDQLSYL
jgi:hypothetical protein